MQMQSIHSGSDGNCAYLALEDHRIILFDLGISCKQIVKRLTEDGFDLDGQLWDILICITHQHSDHWQPITYRTLGKLDTVALHLHFPQTNDGEISWFDHQIKWRKFRHGTITTNFFVVDGKYGYLTDCSGDQIFDLATWDVAYGLDELFIESNYDESYLGYLEQANLAIGYDAMGGFTRHLSNQESDWVVECLKPKANFRTHKSSRFFEPMRLHHA